MKIVVDGFPLWVRTTGIGTYTRELLRALALAGGDDSYYLADMGVAIVKATLPHLTAPLAAETLSSVSRGTSMV